MDRVDGHLHEAGAEHGEDLPWKVLIVDDEPEVHAVTRLVLGGFRFEGIRLDFLSAHSAAEARSLLRRHPDIAVLLLDVVMESEQAGLELVRDVREELANPFVRIVLRTGQAGQAPEHEVIAAYIVVARRTGSGSKACCAHPRRCSRGTARRISAPRCSRASATS